MLELGTDLAFERGNHFNVLYKLLAIHPIAGYNGLAAFPTIAHPTELVKVGQLTLKNVTG